MGLLSGGVNGPLALALSPNSDFLAAGNLNGGGISVFWVSKTTGSLTPVSNSPFPTGGSGFPARGLFHTSGNFFYAGLQLSPTNEIAGFSVDPSTGALSPLPNSPFPGQPPIGGGGVNSVALHPSGGFLYASGSFQGNRLQRGQCWQPGATFRVAVRSGGSIPKLHPGR